MGFLKRKGRPTPAASTVDEARYQQWLAAWPEAVEAVLEACAGIMGQPAETRRLYDQIAEYVRARDLEGAISVLAQHPDLLTDQAEAGFKMTLMFAQMTDPRALPLLRGRLLVLHRARNAGLSTAYQEALEGRLPLDLDLP